MSMLESLAVIMTVVTIGLFAYTIYHEKRKRRFTHTIANGSGSLLPVFIEQSFEKARGPSGSVNNWMCYKSINPITNR